MIAVCSCLQRKSEFKSGGTIQNNLHHLHDKNSTNKIQVKDEILKANLSIKNTTNKDVTATQKQTASEHSDEEPLPIPILIASAAVAVAIFIFISLAYKWHAYQLDAQAKESDAQLDSIECPSPSIPCSPCRNTQRLVPPSQSMQMSFQCQSDSE
jgi:hypothetical protein